jgi:hypothetical protein
MAILAKGGNGGDYQDPPLGLACGLCIDVVDLGEEQSPFPDKNGNLKMQYKIQIVWQLHNENEDGEPAVRTDGRPMRISKFYTLSLNEKANLRQDLDSWRGVPFTNEELMDGFDVEKLIGVQAKLNIITKKNKKGENKVVVDSVLKPSKRDPAIKQDPLFKREKDVPGGRDQRSPAAGAAPAGGGSADQYDEDEDEDIGSLPF